MTSLLVHSRTIARMWVNVSNAFGIPTAYPGARREAGRCCGGIRPKPGKTLSGPPTNPGPTGLRSSEARTGGRNMDVHIRKHDADFNQVGGNCQRRCRIGQGLSVLPLATAYSVIPAKAGIQGSLTKYNVAYWLRPLDSGESRNDGKPKGPGESGHRY